MPTRIDWCDETINPLGHGCFGPGGTMENPNVCEYCYARTMAKRNMRGCDMCRKFIPHTHFEQLDKLQHWKKPRTIFVQSMGDLFGEWVPDEWIQEVFKACEAAPQHRYLFLTKNPGRFQNVFLTQSLNITQNMWFGFSAANQEALDKLAMDARWLPLNSFISIEPLHGEIDLNKINPHGIDALLDFLSGGQYWLTGGDMTGKRLNWVIVGAETGNRKDKIIPKREWIDNIVTQCCTAGVPVFMKDSLIPIMGEENIIRDYPWEPC